MALCKARNTAHSYNTHRSDHYTPDLEKKKERQKTPAMLLEKRVPALPFTRVHLFHIRKRRRLPSPKPNPTTTKGKELQRGQHKEAPTEKKKKGERARTTPSATRGHRLQKQQKTPDTHHPDPPTPALSLASPGHIAHYRRHPREQPRPRLLLHFPAVPTPPQLLGDSFCVAPLPG